MSESGSPSKHMRDSLNRMLDNTFDLATGGAHSMPVDIYETPHSLVILTTPLHGIRPEKIEVEVTERQIIIHVETLPDSHIPPEAYVKRERRYGHFMRKLPLPVTIQPEGVQAQLKDHILTITLPKKS